MKAILYVFCFLYCTASLFCQQISVHTFTVEDGLSNSNVYRIFQDKKGFLWFCTNYGLSRYDGKQFINYTTANGLSHNVVLSVAETSDEQKLICTYGGGLNTLANGKIITGAPAADISLQQAIYCQPYADSLLVIDKQNVLYSYYKGKTKKLFFNPKAGANIFRFIIPISAGSVLLGTKNGLYLYDKAGLKPYYSDIIKGEVNALHKSGSGEIAVGCGQGVYVIDRGKVKKYLIPPAVKISDVLIDEKKRVWVTAQGTVLVLDSNGSIRNITSELKLNNIVINDIFEDRSGNIWLGTHGSGAYCIRSLNIINYPVSAGLINNYTNSIREIGGKIYFASIGTLSYFKDNALHSVQSQYLDEKNSGEYLYFIEGGKDKLYIGIPQGILIKNLENGDEKLINATGAISINKDINGKIWIGGYSRLQLYDERQNSVKDVGEPEGFTRISAMASDSKGLLYLGTNKGVFTFDGEKFKKLAAPGGNGFSIVNSVFIDSKENAWIATDGGVYIYFSGKYTVYSPANGLSHHKCTSVTGDLKGNVWIGTLGGLHMFNGQSFVQYNTSTGLISNEILSLCADSKGNIWAGTASGICCITPRELQDETNDLELYITSASIGDSVSYFPGEIILSPQTQGFRINYSALVFPKADNIEYQYKFDGEGDWSSTTNNSIEFSSLPPGRHIFLLRARKRGGAWSNTVQSLTIVAKAPFWKKTWFYLALFCACSGLMYLFIKNRLNLMERAKREKADVEDKMLQLKHQALSATINPHFVFNCLNSIQAYIHKNERETAKAYLVQFSRLIRNVLEHSKDLYIKLADEAERLDLYLKMETLRFRNKLAYSITIDPAINIYSVEIPNMIVQPFIENAILHGIMPKKEGGNVNVRIMIAEKGMLLITVEDDGIGLTAGRLNSALKNTNEHTSLGMQLIEERLHLLKEINQKAYSVIVKERSHADGTVAGTIVTITLPVKTA